MWEMQHIQCVKKGKRLGKGCGKGWGKGREKECVKQRWKGGKNVTREGKRNVYRKGRRREKCKS